MTKDALPVQTFVTNLVRLLTAVTRVKSRIRLITSDVGECPRS
jgi:hypothetical protein